MQIIDHAIERYPIIGNRVFLARFLAGVIFCAVFGGVWDAWRHDSGGFESVLSSAHLVMYLSAAFGALTALVGFHLYRTDRFWRRIGIAFAFVIASAPFDQAWHMTFGIEQIGSPWLIWSPPHALLLLSVIYACVSLLALLKSDPDPTARRFFSSLIGSALFGFVTLLLVPFIPTGPYHVLGFYGAAVVGVVVSFLLLYMRSIIVGVGATLEVGAWTLVLATVGIWQPLSHSPEIPAHVHLPGWVLVLTILLPASVIDLLYRRMHPAVLGGFTAGIMMSALLLFGRDYFIGESAFANADISLGIALAIMGGFLGGYLHRLYVSK